MVEHNLTYEEWLSARTAGDKTAGQSYYDEEEDIFCGGGCEEEEPDEDII